MTRNQMLRPVMLFDAATCLAMGVLLAAAAGPIAVLTDLPISLLREAGILLFPFALFVLWAARQGATPARFVAGLNLAWAAVSFAVIALTQPNAPGVAFVAAQALAVAGIGTVQLYALGEQVQASRV